MVIGVASTAPGYSLAASLGLVVAVVGLQAPAIMLVAFVPMLFIASAYYYLNRECEAAIVDLRPVEALLRVAEERDARMIVVGTQGEHPLKGAVLGSVPHELLRVSEVPVLVVPG